MSREFLEEAAAAIVIAFLSSAVSAWATRKFSGEEQEEEELEIAGDMCLCPLCEGQGAIPAGATIIVLQNGKSEE